MQYFHVTLFHKGKKHIELIQARSRLHAVQRIKQLFPSAMVIKVVQTSAPLEEIFQENFLKIKHFFTPQISMSDKIATIRQIAVMTDICNHYCTKHQIIRNLKISIITE